MGEHCLIIVRIVERLHIPPCPNDEVSGYNMSNRIDIFWQEFITGGIWLDHMLFTKTDFLLLMQWSLVGKVVDMSLTCRKVGQMSENFDSNVAVFNTSYWRFLICRTYQMMTPRKKKIGIFNFLLRFWILCDKRITSHKKKKNACSEVRFFS